MIIGIDAQGHVTSCDRFRLPYELTMQRIADLPSNVTKVIDQAGVGEVVEDQLQLYIPYVLGFKFTEESKPKLLYHLMKQMEQGQVKYTQEYVQEMLTFMYRYTSSGHIQFESRTEYTVDRIM